MPTARFQFDNRQDELTRNGPIIPVRIGMISESPVDGNRTADVSSPRHWALVDTGAWDTCIDSNLAIELGLTVVDAINVAGAHGVAEANVYLAQIHVPDLDYNFVGEFAGVDLSFGGQGLSALIGRTFLRNFTMIYEGRTGTVAISND